MELVVAVAIGVLSVIFVGSLIALLLVCRHRYCFFQQFVLHQQQQSDQKPILKYSKDNLEAAGGGTTNTNSTASTTTTTTTTVVIGAAGDYNSTACGGGGGNEYELEDVLQLSPNIEKVLKDNDWINDATGLVQHCLAILKSCHSVTDKLSGLSFSSVHHGDQELMEEVRRATGRVMPRVDDLVRAMYANTSGRKRVQAAILEARAGALVLAINNLVLAFRLAYGRRAGPGPGPGFGYPDWLCSALMDMECQLNALREASQLEEDLQQQQQQTTLVERVEFFPTNNNNRVAGGGAKNDLVISTASV